MTTHSNGPDADPRSGPRRRSPPRAHRLLAALALAALSGVALSCRSVEGTRGLPPLFEIYDTPSTDTPSSLTQPDFPDPDAGYRAIAGKEWYFRPFGSYERLEDGRRRTRLFYPFLDFRSGPDERLWRIFPIFRHQSRVKRDGTRDSDTMLFPFLFWGHDPEEGGYFMFFPFGGQVKGLLGTESAVTVLFPLYARLDRGGRTSRHILWPFVNHVTGAGWSGWRFWPFWGSYAWDTEDGEPRARRRFILWPFYIRNSEFLDRQPTEIFFTLPFYGYRENDRSLTETYLWPFYVYYHDKKNDRTLHGGYAFPYRFTEGQRDYWPFWGTKRTTTEIDGQEPRRRFRQFALWPIQRYDWAEDEREETTRFWFLPFFYRFEHLDKRDLTTRDHWTFWPLVFYAHRAGETEVDILSPLWLDRTAYRRFWGRLFAIFRYRSREDFSGWELLYGTLYWGRTPDEARFSVLGGLLELGSSRDSFIFRLLWIPW